MSRLPLIGLMLLSVSCAKSEFAGAPSSDQAPSSAVASPTPMPPNEVHYDDAKPCDMTKDFVELKFPDPAIQECVNKGMIWDFKQGGCSNVSKATSYECSFEGLKKAVASLGLSTGFIDQGKANNGKLIGCGEKRQGRTVVAQWWYPNQANEPATCEFNQSMTIATGCYQLYSQNETPDESGTTEERVARCLAQ